MIFLYTSKEVKDEKLIKISVRGDSRKEAIDVNNKLFVYFLHGCSLYYWKKTSNSCHHKLEKICVLQYPDYKVMNDNRLLFLTSETEEDKTWQHLEQIMVNYTF